MKDFNPVVQQKDPYKFNGFAANALGNTLWNLRTYFPECKSVLLVGVGDGMLLPILKKLKIKVITIDIDSSLKPDYQFSVHELEKKFIAEQFDVIICYNVLEHLPFSYFDSILSNMRKVCKIGVLLSFPQAGYNFFWKGKPFMKIPLFYFKPHKYEKGSWGSAGIHYWELDTLQTSKSVVRRVINKHFFIQDEYLDRVDVCNRRYVLRKKQ